MGVKESHDKISMNISIEFVVFTSLNPLNESVLVNSSIRLNTRNHHKRLIQAG